ncbi:MAG TPA: hypothetical protein VNQ90_21200 [Chthoniobacteraceae bacterium]|nr:hypothetical protein [Chthoniobacteraceae bacterium]
MTPPLLPFMILAAIGFLASVGAHIASLLDLTLPGGKLVWLLHAGVFIVWFPAILLASRINRGRPQFEYWKSVLSGCPPWMRYAVCALFVYAIGNFAWFMATTGLQPPPIGDAPPSIVRGFSGHWLIFYGAAFAMLFSIYRNPALLKR